MPQTMKLLIHAELTSGVPDTLAQEIHRRRDGNPVVLSRPRRLVRARRIMQDGIARLSHWPHLAV